MSRLKRAETGFAHGSQWQDNHGQSLAGPLSSRICLLFGVLSLLGSSGVGTAFGNEAPGYRRWAVLASASVAEEGLPELLTVALSQYDKLELVERQELKLALEEQKLSHYLGPQAGGKRLKLGKLLGADALLLLSLKEREDRQFLKAVVSECRYGARLQTAHFTYATDRLQALSQSCAELVDRTRQQFSGGVRYLIGVPQFVSQNLTHEYDHLQAGYATLLGTALGQHAGVAVLETEEAEVIAHELSLTGTDVKDRVVPLFVTGEFEVTRASPQVKPEVNLTLRVSDGREVRETIRRGELSLQEAAGLLSGEISRKLIRLSTADGPGLSRSQQRKALLQRADTFSRLGSYEEAIGLREAALLLEPDAPEQRIRILGETRRLYYARNRVHSQRHRQTLIEREHFDQNAPEFQALLSAWHVEQMHRFRLFARHLEYLIRHRALNPREATVLTGMIIRVTSGRRLAKPEHGRELKDALDDFFWRVFLRVSKLDPMLRDGQLGEPVQRALQADCRDTWSPIRQYREWAQRALQFLTVESPRSGARGLSGTLYDDRRTLEDLYRFLTEVADPEIPIPAMARLVTGNSRFNPDSFLNGMIRQGRFEVEDVRGFYERLKQTGQPTNLYYARLGLLALQIHFGEDRPSRHDILRQIDACIQQTEGFGHSLSVYHRLFLEHFRKQALKVLSQRTKDNRSSPSDKQAMDHSRTQQVLFTPVPDIEADWHALLKCTDSLDAMWSATTVYVMPQKGVVKKIFHLERGLSYLPRDMIYSVHWDGADLWIATMSSGIHVISPTGQIRAHIHTEEGLPPYENKSFDERSPFWRTDPRRPAPCSLRLHPLRRGRCIVIGQFGKNQRLWFALVSLDETSDGQPTVNVFHTAKNVPRAISNQDDGDPYEIFEPTWIAEYPQKNSRRLLVGRQVRGIKHFKEGRRPLAIDLQTLKASIFPARFHGIGKNWCPLYVIHGHVLYAYHTGIALFSPPQGKSSNWKQTHLVKITGERVRDRLRYQQPNLIRSLLLEYDGFIYSPGPRWWRIDPNTWEADQVTDSPLPKKSCFHYYSVSAHYGLIAWKRRRPITGPLHIVSFRRSDNSRGDE